jgi:polyferredoxin
MATFYRLAADAVVVVHFSYVAFVMIGLLAILLGLICRWGWVRNIWFRSLHLLAILVVAAEAICGITCPLTTWEQRLRALAGDTSYQGDFIADWVHRLMFFDCQPWVFTLCYVLFGLVVLATFVLAPPRWNREQRAS